LSSNEIRRLLALLVLTTGRSIDRILAWSDYRQLRRQQAQHAHYRKRLKHLEGYASP